MHRVREAPPCLRVSNRQTCDDGTWLPTERGQALPGVLAGTVVVANTRQPPTAYKIWLDALGYSGAIRDKSVDEPPPPVLPDLPEPAALPYVEPPAPNSIEGRFFEGYRDGGAPYPEGRIEAMIWCESRWRLDPGNELGLAQFTPGSWGTVSSWTGFYDWLNPYHQGYNVAVWAVAVSAGTTAGWPTCWWAW